LSCQHIYAYIDSSDDEEREESNNEENAEEIHMHNFEMEENKEGNKKIPLNNPQLPQGLLPKDPHLPQGLPPNPHLPQGLPPNSNPVLRSRLAEAAIIQELYDNYLNK
jgi:hypothetical protein